MPTAEAVREQLHRVVTSATFAMAARQRRLLEFVVERALAQEHDRLKEYVLATEVFDRPETYDSRLDSTVRVEAGRLRRRLEHYYRGPGAADPVLIAIPRGTYAPVFSEQTPSTAALGNDGRMREFDRRAAGRRWLAVAVVAVSSLVFVASRVQSDRTSATVRHRGPAIVVLPFESFSEAADHRLLAVHLTDHVTALLASGSAVSVASRTSASHYATHMVPVAELARRLGVQFVLEASAVVRGGRVRVVARLVDATVDRKVWVGVYEASTGETETVAGRVASDAARVARERFDGINRPQSPR